MEPLDLTDEPQRPPRSNGGRRAWRMGRAGVLARLALLCVGLAGAIPHLNALEVAVRFYGEAEGLPVGEVTALAQTADGYLKVGTPAGLVGFDGLGFSPEKGAPNSAVRDLFVAGSGGDWGGLTQGGTGFVNEKGAFRLVYARHEGHNMWGRLMMSPDGGFMGAVHGGILRIAPDGTRQILTPPGLVLKPICTLVGLTRGGGPLVIHNSEMWKFENGSWSQELGLPPLTLNLGKGFCVAPDGTYWQAFGHRLARKGPGEEAWTTLTEEVGQRGKGFTECVAATSGGRVWVSTSQGGLWSSDDKVTFQPALIGGKPLDFKIECLLVDRRDQLWAGTKEYGLARISPAGLTAVSLKEGEAAVRVTAMMDAGDGAWVVGTHEHGIKYWKDGNLDSWVLSGAEIHDTFGNAFLKDPDGGIYAAGGFGLYRVRDRVRLPNDQFGGIFSTGDSVMTLCWEKEGSFYAGVRGGNLYRVQNGKVEWLREHGRGMLNAMVRAPDGTVWAGTTSRGVERVGEKGEYFGHAAGLRSNTVMALHVDGRGRLWVGTVGGGLAIRRGGRFFSFGMEEGLIEETVSQIVDDGVRLWFGGNKGIFSVPFSEFDAVMEGRERQVGPVWLGKGEHLYPTPLPAMAPARAADGLLAFGTNRGFILVRPPALETPPPAPEVRFQSIEMDGVPVDAGAKDLHLPPGPGRLQLEWAGLSLNFAEQLRFRYRMAGFDEAWRDARQERRAVYGGLPPGEYVFEVAARVGTGPWSQNPSRFPVRVVPHFWQTWWFRGLSLVLPLGMAAGLGYLLDRRKRNALSAKLAQVKAVEAERIRIARDLHDHLGGTMTEMALLSQLAQANVTGNSEATHYLERILETAQLGARALGEIVWATDPAHDTLDSFVKQLAEMVRTSSPLCHRMVLPSELPEHQISAGVRQHLYLAMKEGLNNLHKHASATEITLDVSCQAGLLKISLADNGRGFETGAAPPFGSDGLKNMKERMAQVGGEMSVETEPGLGTSITLSLPLHRLG